MSVPPELSPRRGPSALKVIGLIFLVLILVCGGVVTVVAWNFKAWTASFARSALVTEIRNSSLSEDQKTRIIADIHRLSDAFEAGDLGFTQLGSTMQQLAEGPFFDLIIIDAVRAQYNTTVETDDKERDRAMRLFDRFQRGIVEETISDDEVDEILSLVTDEEDDQREQKENLTEAELEAFVAAMREQVDAANVPDEPYEVDFAGELEKVTTELLGPADKTESDPTSATQPEE